jgi:hypothetical protein
MTTDLLPLSPDQGRAVAPVETIIAATRRQLAEARSLVELEAVSRQAAAISDLAQRARAADATRFEAALLVLDCERRLGRAIVEAPKARGTRGVLQAGMRGVDTGGSRVDPPAAAPTLAEAGIGKSRAARARHLYHMGGIYTDVVARAAGLMATGQASRAHTLVTVRGMLRAWRDEVRVRDGAGPRFDDIIKSTDNWTVGADHRYPRLEAGTEADEWGYIPGDVLCNVLWYFSRPGDVVVDPMAGSGMTRHVYDDRHNWMWPEPWDLDIRLFDLSPRGLYADQTGRLDLMTEPLPVERADLIILDPPYYGIARGCYGDDPANLANLDWPAYRGTMARIAARCAAVQAPGGRLVLMTSDFSDVLTGEEIAVARLLDRTFQDAGYVPGRLCPWSRRIEQNQSPLMGRKKNWARERRIMMTDEVFVLSFRRV